METNSDDVLFIDKINTSVIITFGGIKNGIGIPVFEFKRILSDYNNYNQYFFRDQSQSWYHNGVEDIANNIDDLAKELKRLISRYDKVVFMGNSMGGYAAILFGALLNIDIVIAFSPQTYIGKYRRYYYRDYRWKNQIKSVNNITNKPRYFNLKRILKNYDYDTYINIYYSSSDKLDKTHVDRIRNIKNISLVDYATGGHNMVRSLKDNNILKQILDENLL